MPGLQPILFEHLALEFGEVFPKSDALPVHVRAALGAEHDVQVWFNVLLQRVSVDVLGDALGEVPLSDAGASRW